MIKISRRKFIKGFAAAGAVSLFPMRSVWGQVQGANEEIRVAVAGFRSKGKSHIQHFQEIPGVQVIALCDVDQALLGPQVEEFQKEYSREVHGYTDIRKVLDRKDVDAIICSTTNHWHALMTVWACQAGKDVYVEKPVSHEIWEGRKMVQAARKYNRIVQSGTQARSDTGLQEALEYIRQGELGKILCARSIRYGIRKSIGKVKKDQNPPESVDYDLWCGPAPILPVRREKFHYDWHWQWPYGNGELGNWGSHVLDMARWFLGKDTAPKTVLSVGGRFGYADDGQTPNTQVVIYDYADVPLVAEVRGLPRKSGEDTEDVMKGIRSGVIIECEGGFFSGGFGGGWAYDPQGKKMKQFKGDGGKNHAVNFIQSVRSRQPSDLNCDIEEGHRSAILCHMGNISHQLGWEKGMEEIRAEFPADDMAKEVLGRFEAHLSANQIDMEKTSAILGPVLTFDSQTERFVGPASERANAFLKRTYRQGFEIPDSV